MPKPLPVKLPFRRRAARFILRRLRSLILIYLVVGLMLAAFQTQLIFQGTSTQGTPDCIVTPPPLTELLHLHSPDESKTPIIALFGKALTPSDTIDPDYSQKPTLVYFYGNAMCLNDALQEIRQFRRLGANVICPDYSGYGMSGGKPSEQGCYHAADAAYNYILSRDDLDHTKLIPAGWSLGAAVAIDLAYRHASDHHICGLITFSAFTSMSNVGQYHYPIFPVSLLLTHRFESETKMKSIRVPTLIVHGRRDDIVPFPMSDRLAKSAAGPVQRLTSESAAHNDLFAIAEGDIDTHVARFLEQFLHNSFIK